MTTEKEKEQMKILSLAHREGRLEGENRILKQILEQLLKIELIPKLKFE